MSQNVLSKSEIYPSAQYTSEKKKLLINELNSENPNLSPEKNFGDDFEMLEPPTKEEMMFEIGDGEILRGRPSRLHDIMKLESPFYRCSQATVLVRHNNAVLNPSKSFIHKPMPLFKENDSLYAKIKCDDQAFIHWVLQYINFRSSLFLCSFDNTSM